MARTIWAYVEAVHPEWDVTLDVDAQIIETSKASARYCYEGCKAYQPMEVSWAETMLVLGDEFRDGNVPASKDTKRVVDGAFDMLPPGPWRVRVRSDSAAYDQNVLDHWDGRGWGFGVSADMSRQLRQEIERLLADAWQVWKIEKGGVVREWAEVPCVPDRHYEDKDSRPYRYLAAQRAPGYADSRGSSLKTGPRRATLQWSPTCGTWRGKRSWSGRGARQAP